MWWPTAATAVLLGASYGVYALLAWTAHWQDAAAELETQASARGERIVSLEADIEQYTLLTDINNAQLAGATTEAQEAAETAAATQARTDALRAALQEMMDCSLEFQRLSDTFYTTAATNAKLAERTSQAAKCDAAYASYKEAADG